jgi:hypothetical protein
MTDYSELVNDLREYLTTRQISDLLEAHAKEIANLEFEVHLRDDALEGLSACMDEVKKKLIAQHDALIKKDASIAELEKREKHLEEMFHGWRDEAIKASARIAELETANKTLRGLLKPFADVKERDIELWYGLDPDPFVPDDAALNSIDNSPTVGDLRAARAALNGEK